MGIGIDKRWVDKRSIDKVGKRRKNKMKETLTWRRWIRRLS